MPDLSREEREVLAYLRTRTGRDFSYYRNQLPHFAYEANKLHDVAAYVVAVTRHTYPRLDMPWHSRWRHFNAGGVDRLTVLTQRLAALDRAERTRCYFDLVITSVLLDAGAGTQWHYHETASGTLRRTRRGEFSHVFQRPVFKSWRPSLAGRCRGPTTPHGG